jgi:hypothetical protein
LPQVSFLSEAEHLSRDTSRDTFVQRGECAARGRLRHAALSFRRAEFFVILSDPCKKLLSIRVTYSVASTAPRSARGTNNHDHHYVPLVQLREQDRADDDSFVQMTRSSN